MDFDIWEVAVVAILAWVVVNVMRGGRWNRDTRRWERFHPDNPYVKSGQIPNEDLRARKELEDLRQRVATLEKLVTDPTVRLEAEIEKLKGRAEGGDR